MQRCSLWAARTIGATLVAGAALAANARPALADPPAVGLPTPTIPQGFGVNIHFTDPQPGEMTRFSEAGFGFARMDFDWERVEKTQGVYDFSAYDRLYETLAKVGTRPLFILDYGNKLYDQGPPRKPEARAAFARFAAAAVHHFAGKGVVWEIWNEPNGDGFWPPRGNPSEYAAMAVEAAKAIREADPKCTLVAPGSSGFPWDYLEVVFKSGLLSYLDGVSVHPYRGNAPETAAADFAHLRSLIGRYAPPEKRQMPIISSEWGYSTKEGGGISEAQQGQYIAREWLSNLASGVDLSIYYDWKEDGPDPKENEHHFGTVRPDYTPKPAFLAAQSLIAGLRGYTFRHRLQGKTDADWKLLFQRGDSGDLALVTWSAAETASASDQTPSIRKVDPADASYTDLFHLASVRYTEGPRAVGLSVNAPIDVHAINSGMQTARVSVSVQLAARVASPLRAKGSTDMNRNLRTGETADDLLNAPAPGDRSTLSTCQVAITWNDKPLPPLFPITLVRIDPLTISAAPWRNQLRATIENPAGFPLDGVATLYSGSKVQQTTPFRLNKGETSANVSFALPASDADFHIGIESKTAKGILAQTPEERLLVFPGFATTAEKSDFARIDVVENAAQPGRTTLPVVKTMGDVPAETALAVAYRFTPGWYYTEVALDKTLTAIPLDASAVVLHLRGDGSGNALRARFSDATGQTFQPDMGSLDTRDWRQVTIPLDGTRSAHWGGANDGVPHAPLKWDSLLLIDSASPKAPHSGEVLVAAPYYVLQGAGRTHFGSQSF